MPKQKKARRDQDAQSGVQALQAAIDEGLASGVSPRTLDEILAKARERDRDRDSD